MSKPFKRSPKHADSYRRRKPDQLFQQRTAETAAVSSAKNNHSDRVQKLIQLGIEAFQTRRFDDAAGHLTNALALEPRNAVAHNCLGVVRRAQGDVDQAIACYEESLQCESSYAEAHNNLGVALEARGELARAAKAYEAALKIRPQFAAALNNHGNALTKLGKPHEAVKQLRKALQEQPGFAAAHNNLGLALVRLKQPDEAEQSFRLALQYQQRFPEAFVNLGNSLRAKKDFDNATTCYHSALQIRPRFPAALSGLGNTLLDQRRFDEARECYERALQLDGQFAEAHFGQGNVYLEFQQWDRAQECFRRALECDPEYTEALNNLGTAYRAAGRLDLAEQAYQDAVRVNGDLVAAHNNLGNLYRIQDRLDLAANSYRQVLARQPDQPLAKLRISTLCPSVFNSRQEMDDYLALAESQWRTLQGACPYRDFAELLTVANEPPYNLQFFAENIRPLKTAYADIFRYGGPEFEPPPRANKIRIGTVVTSGHELAFLRLIWESLSRMNRDEFELSIVCSADSATKFHTSIHDRAVRIVPMPEQVQQIIPTLRNEHFDILHYFEICTDARNYFLPHFRLAPVQVTSWGIQVTSGISNVDSYLSSDLIESPEAQEHYSERLIRANTLLSYQRRSVAPENPKSRAAFGFSASEHLYVCAQHLGKFHPDFDVVLAEILRRDPLGRIVGTEDKFGFGAKRLRERWSRTIPDVASRILLLPRLSQAEYMSLLLAGDVMLDPLYFGGVSTTYDGLSLNLPIVTLPTRQHRGRYTAGCFARMGLSDCVATNAEQYVRLAVQLASDRDRRSAISTQIREQSGRIFEDQESVAEHERIFREMARGMGR